MDLKKLKAIVIICIKILFICGAFALVAKKVDVEKFGSYFINLNLKYFVLALLVSNVSLFVSALRSRYYFHQNGLLLRKRFAISIYYIGYFFNIILPGGIGGDGLKVLYLSKLEKFSKIKSLRIILYERVNGFYALIVLGFLVYYFTTFMHVFQDISYINTVLLILVTPVYLWGVKYVLRDNINTAINASVYSFMVQSLQVFSAYLLILSLDVLNLDAVNTADFIYMFIVASILTIIPITIGGIGVRELVFLYGVQIIGYQNIDAAVAYAFLNFVIYVFTSLPGIFILYRVNTIERITAKKMKNWWI